MSSSIPRVRPPQRSNTTVPSSIPTRSSSTREPSISRNASPTRLPSFKYGARAASIASSSSSSTNSLKNTAAPTNVSSGIPKAPTATGIPGRLTRSMTLATKEVIARKERTASANKYPPSTTMTRPSLQTRGRSTSISMPGKPKELERRPTGIAFARTSATNLAGPVVTKPPNPSRSRDPIRRPATPTAPGGAPGTSRRSATPTALTRANTFSAPGRPVTPTAAPKARTPPSSSSRTRTPPMGLTRAATFSASTRSATSTASATRSSGPRSIARSVTPTPTPTVARGGNSAASSRAVTPTGPPRMLERRAPSTEKLPARKPSLATIGRVVSRLSKPSSAGTLLSQDQASLKPRTSASSLQRPGSPGKSLAPKLSTSHLAPTSPSKLPSNIAASAEVSKLQAELLQLYLLNREAPVVEAEWRASAKQKLGDRFAKLSEDSRDVSEQESVAQEKKNVLALRRWGSGGRLDEKIQSLEFIITNVWSLSDPSGRYAQLVRHFERWIGGVSDMEEARRKGAMLAQGNNDLFIEDLDAQWKGEREELIDQLNGWKQQLGDIDDLTLDEFYAEPPDEDERSSLEKMLNGSRALIDNMLAELRIMEVVEHEALLREDEWIGRMNRIDADDNFEIPRASGAWKEI